MWIFKTNMIDSASHICNAFPTYFLHHQEWFWISKSKWFKVIYLCKHLKSYLFRSYDFINSERLFVLRKILLVYFLQNTPLELFILFLEYSKSSRLFMPSKSLKEVSILRQNLNDVKILWTSTTRNKLMSLIDKNNRRFIKLFCKSSCNDSDDTVLDFW